MSYEMSQVEGIFQELESIINETEDKEMFKEALENLHNTLSDAYDKFDSELKEIREEEHEA